MATETDFPHPPSIRELQERGWALAKAGKAQRGLALLKKARRMESQEAKRIKALKEKQDLMAEAVRRED